MTDSNTCTMCDPNAPEPDCSICGGTGALPEGMVLCSACKGTGGSGEFEERYAPATWDDPGYYEVEELSCPACRGRGLVPKPADPIWPPPAFTATPLDDDLPF